MDSVTADAYGRPNGSLKSTDSLAVVSHSIAHSLNLGILNKNPAEENHSIENDKSFSRTATFVGEMMESAVASYSVLNLEDADKLAFGRSADARLFTPLQQQQELPDVVGRWNGASFLWQDRESKSTIWSQHRQQQNSSCAIDDQDDPSSSNSRVSRSSSSQNHNNTTLLAGNLLYSDSSSNSKPAQDAPSTRSCSSSLWSSISQHVHLHDTIEDADFSDCLSQLTMKQQGQPGSPFSLSGEYVLEKQQTQPLNSRLIAETKPSTPDQSPINLSSSCTVSPNRGTDERNYVDDGEFCGPAYFLPTTSFPHQTTSSSLSNLYPSFSEVADLVPVSSNSTYTNESVFNSSLVSYSPASVSSTSTFVPPTDFTPPQERQTQPRHNNRRKSYNHNQSFPDNNSLDNAWQGGIIPNNAVRPYHRKNSNRSETSTSAQNGGGRRRNQGRNNSNGHTGNASNNRNNRHHFAGPNRKQPRSSFPTPSIKERSSPHGKRSKDIAPPPLRNKDSNSEDSSGSPHRTTTTDHFGKAQSEALRQPIKAKQQYQLHRDEELSWRNSYSPENTTSSSLSPENHRPILPQQHPEDHADFAFQFKDYQWEDDDVLDSLCHRLGDHDDYDDDESSGETALSEIQNRSSSPETKKLDWLLHMNRKLQDTPVGSLDPGEIPVSTIMNAWAKTKSVQGASMVELWLSRVRQEADAGNVRVIPTSKMYTMAVDAWARSGEGGTAAQRAESLLQQMNELYQQSRDENLRPTTGIFNAVINAWARSKERIAAIRAEHILNWMQNLNPNLNVIPDKYTFNTVIHSYAKAGGTEAAIKAQELLSKMHQLYQEGNISAKPDTISYNVVINCWAKSGGKTAANEAEKLLAEMHNLNSMGESDIKPNVVTYGAVIDAFAKCGESGAAARADTLLANMIEMHQLDPVRNADLMPNTYVFNTVINCWAKSKEPDAASKAEEMLVAMSRLHASGMSRLKPDAFTYTAVIDAWAKSGYRGAASRADQLLDKMEAKYLAGDIDLKPNTFTYNAVINALAKSGEAGAAARAERVLQNMVNRHRNGGGDDVKPTTINFNTVLDAWAKSGGGRAAAERAEEILEWMDRLHKQGNEDVKPDTITFNAVLDAWARSGDRVAPRRAEQILDHMDELCRGGNRGVKPDTYTYNTLINAWAKSGERGSAARAEHVLSVMEKRYRDGDADFKPNTRTHTSVIDAWAKSGEKGAAMRANQILNNMITRYEATGDVDAKPNVHTANAVCNACAFSKHDDDRVEALQIAFRVYDWLSSQDDMQPDSYTYTILLSVCANLIPRHDGLTRFAQARSFFNRCRDAGHVNDYVLRKLRQTVTDEEFQSIIEYRSEATASAMPPSWSRNARLDGPSKNHQNHHHHRKGKWQGRRRS